MIGKCGNLGSEGERSLYNEILQVPFGHHVVTGKVGALWLSLLPEGLDDLANAEAAFQSAVVNVGGIDREVEIELDLANGDMWLCLSDGQEFIAEADALAVWDQLASQLGRHLRIYRNFRGDERHS